MTSETKKPTDDVMAVIPALRAYARALCRNSQDADDLVQETLLKALSKIDSFQAGSNMRAWLFTIMRNSFLTEIKKRARERPGAEDCIANHVLTFPDHDWVILRKKMLSAVGRLPDQFREVLVLVLILGESYEDTARICNVRIGTVKSRVNRARHLVIEELGADALAEMMDS